MLRNSPSTLSSAEVRSTASHSADRNVRAVGRPSAVSQVAARDFTEPRPFELFGTWAAPITVACNGTIRRLARWLALNRGRADDAGDLWRLCQQENVACFRQFRVVRLARRSFFLPAGEVAFEVLTNPTQIPDRPPTGVMLRHMEAMDAFPGATFYFLRPVFVADPSPRLCLPVELREEAHFDEYDAIRTASWFGWAFRGQARLAAQAYRVAIATVRAAARTIEMLNRWSSPGPTARRIGREILRRPVPLSLERRLARAESLGLEVETQRLRWALEELRRRVSVDPILCFELPKQPGKLWFEAHWYDGIDGRTYVHY